MTPISHLHTPDSLGFAHYDAMADAPDLADRYYAALVDGTVTPALLEQVRLAMRAQLAERVEREREEADMRRSDANYPPVTIGEIERARQEWIGREAA